MAKLIKAKRNFTIMSNSTLQTTLLSTKAKGMLSTLLSLPDNWDFSVSGLAKHFCKEGKDAVREMLNELEHLGYLVRRQLKGKNGRFGRNVYFISDTPLTDEDIEMLMKKHGYKEEDFVANKASAPLSDFPSTGIQSSETPTQINNIKTKKKKEINYSIRQSDTNSNLEHETEKDLQIYNDLPDRKDKAENDKKPVPVAFDDEAFKKQIGYDRLIADEPEYADQIDSVVDVVSKTFESIKGKVKVSKRYITREKAVSAFSKLEDKHIMYVISKFNKQKEKQHLHDPSAYMLTMLYNAPHEYSLSNTVKTKTYHENDLHSFDISDIQDIAPYESVHSFTLEDIQSLANSFDNFI